MLKGSCKKIFASVAIISLAGSIFPVMPIVSAENLPSYYERNASEREKALLSARDFAFEYLKNSSEEPLWNGKYPYISGEKFFYTANDEIPSYVEFKVSTGENPDSGFIIVNLDNNDVQVPIASPSGKTPSEALNIRFDKNHGNSQNEKLYYFSPFDQWIVDEKGNAETLNPNNQEDEMIEKIENNSEISLRSAENSSEKNFETILTEEGKNKQNAKFAEMKKNAVEFVNSEEMRSARVMERSSRGYIKPSPSNIFLPGYKDSWWNSCKGSLPCYNQFTLNNGELSGCGPTALGIVIGYYDQRKFKNLMPNVDASDFLNTDVKQMITEIGDFMGVQRGGVSATAMSQGVQYIRNKGYGVTAAGQSNNNATDVYWRIRSEIDAERPVILLATIPNEMGHIFTAFGYNKNVPGVVRVNLGWGTVKDNGIVSSNIDFSLNALHYKDKDAYLYANYLIHIQ